MKNLPLCVPGQKQMDQKSLDGWIWKIGWPFLYPKSYKKLEEQNFHLPARFSPICKFHIVDSGTGVKKKKSSPHSLDGQRSSHRHGPPYMKSLENCSVHKLPPPHSDKNKDGQGTQFMASQHPEIPEARLGQRMVHFIRTQSKCNQGTSTNTRESLTLLPLWFQMTS